MTLGTALAAFTSTAVNSIKELLQCGHMVQFLQTRFSFIVTVVAGIRRRV